MDMYFCPLFSGSSGNALFCQYGETRLLIDALQEKGYRVPEDVSVTGFDDYPAGSDSEIPLSTFRIDTDGMIELAVKTLLERCAGEQKPFGRMVVSGQPVYRESEIPHRE